MSWPSIQAPTYPMEEEVYLPQYKGEFEAGYVHSRPRATVSKLRWTLRWDHISAADYATLKAYFIANQGGTFSWTNPETTTAYTVRFAEDSMKFQYAFKGHLTGQVVLEQAL